jgi:hypothetical protein
MNIPSTALPARAVLFFFSVTLIALIEPMVAQAPGPDFKLLKYLGLGAAYAKIEHNCQANHVDEVMDTVLDPGKVVDTSYQQSPIPSGYGPENHNPNLTSVPPGIRVSPTWNGNGEGGIFNLSVSQTETTNTSHQKVLAVHLNLSLYVGPPCGDSLATPSQISLNAWVKQRDAPTPSKTSSRPKDSH